MSALWKALLEAQKEIKHATKDSKNPHLRNTYASLNSVLDEVKPIFNKNGLVLTQHVKPLDANGNIVVVTRITVAETGESTEDALPVPVKHKFNKEGVDIGPDAQELGSAITYGRRYGLQAMCGIGSEDDDGNSASGTGSKPSVATESAKGPDTNSPPADPAAKAAVEKKLGSVLGFKKN